jgi:hypothetical protein
MFRSEPAVAAVTLTPTRDAGHENDFRSLEIQNNTRGKDKLIFLV